MEMLTIWLIITNQECAPCYKTGKLLLRFHSTNAEMSWRNADFGLNVYTTDTNVHTSRMT